MITSVHLEVDNCEIIIRKTLILVLLILGPNQILQLKFTKVTFIY